MSILNTLANILAHKLLLPSNLQPFLILGLRVINFLKLLLGAKTPLHLTRCALGGGINAKSFSMNSY